MNLAGFARGRNTSSEFCRLLREPLCTDFSNTLLLTHRGMDDG